MIQLPPDHAERFALAEEVHARPPEPMPTPARATYLAVLVDADDRGRESAHLARLCERFGVAPPARELTHFSARMGGLQVKWERHGEFSSWTIVAPGAEREAFAEPASSLLPEGWLGGLPGATSTKSPTAGRSTGSTSRRRKRAAGCALNGSTPSWSW